jgi:hypothetical protein
MPPPFNYLRCDIFNNICSFYQLLQLVITSYSPSFLTLNWSTYLLSIFGLQKKLIFTSRTDNVDVPHAWVTTDFINGKHIFLLVSCWLTWKSIISYMQNWLYFRSYCCVLFLLACCYLHLSLSLRKENWGTRWRSWLKHCPTTRKVAGSINGWYLGLDTCSYSPDAAHWPPVHPPWVDNTSNFLYLAPTEKGSNPLAAGSHGIL